MIKLTNKLKKKAANVAIELIKEELNPNLVIGIGTGSTTDFFIDKLKKFSKFFKGAVASSYRSAIKLKKCGIELIDLKDVKSIPIYIDGADEINNELFMIKGKGGALTYEKVLSSVSDLFICIVEESKLVNKLGTLCPLPIEILPISITTTTKFLRNLGGEVFLRKKFITESGNLILDVFGLSFKNVKELEICINNIPGVVSCGIFSLRSADIAIISRRDRINFINF